MTKTYSTEVQDNPDNLGMKHLEVKKRKIVMITLITQCEEVLRATPRWKILNPAQINNSLQREIIQ
jgi:hypothetical protein